MKTSLSLIGIITILILIFSCTEKKARKDLVELRLIGKVKFLTETKYNTIEKLGEIQKGDVKVKTIKSFFNEQGNIIEKKCFGPKDSLYKKYIWKYDSKECEIEKNIYNPDGSLLFKYVFKYDNKSNRIDNCYDPNGILAMKTVNKFDNKGNKIEEDIYFPNDSLDHKYIYKYDDKDNQIEESEFSADGALITKHLQIFNENDYKVEDNLFNSKGNLISKTTFKYSYDTIGNWIKQIEIRNGIPIFIIEREIEYYQIDKK